MEIGTKSIGDMRKGSPGVPLFAIPDVLCCRIVERVNRFVVKIEIGGEIQKAHINNTGRHQEIIVNNKAIGLYFDPNDFCLYLYDPDLDAVLRSQ
jgi:hypothetical protein